MQEFTLTIGGQVPAGFQFHSRAVGLRLTALGRYIGRRLLLRAREMT
jgi:hypothetical protein